MNEQTAYYWDGESWKSGGVAVRFACSNKLTASLLTHQCPECGEETTTESACGRCELCQEL